MKIVIRIFIYLRYIFVFFNNYIVIMVSKYEIWIYHLGSIINSFYFKQKIKSKESFTKVGMCVTIWFIGNITLLATVTTNKYTYYYYLE